MSLTLSTMLPLKSKAPDFKLGDVISGKVFTLKDFADKKLLLVMFICRHCPYVQHIKKELANLGREYPPKNVAMVAISSNDAENYAEDAPTGLREMARESNFSFPFLYDEDQSVAKAYSAACTPDFFLFDQNRQLIYRGQLDDSRPGNGKPVTGADLRMALDAALAGQPIDPHQKPSAGCNIKWKRGMEPAYSRR